MEHNGLKSWVEMSIDDTGYELNKLKTDIEDETERIKEDIENLEVLRQAHAGGEAFLGYLEGLLHHIETDEEQVNAYLKDEEGKITHSIEEE